MATIQIDAISIYSPGDPQVGIFSGLWEITPEAWIEEEDIDTFVKDLKAAWEHLADDAKIGLVIGGVLKYYN